MPFSVSWHTLLEELDELSDDAELVTPPSHDIFRVTGVQEYRVVVTSDDTEERRPLQRDRFKTLHRRVRGSNDAFELDRLPPDADPCPAVLNPHPRFEVDEEQGSIAETETETGTQLLSGESAPAESDRVEPDEIDMYSDVLLLTDALKRQDVSDLTALETEALVNLYTPCSDVQRNADELRQDIADALLDRLHYDQPVHRQYDSIQRTSCRNRSLKDEEDVLATLEGAGIDRECVMSADSKRVDEALEVTELSETDVHEVDEGEYVRKAEVDEDIKESRLQGLKDRLMASSDAESGELKQEIEVLEECVDDLTSFSMGTQMQG